MEAASGPVDWTRLRHCEVTPQRASRNRLSPSPVLTIPYLNMPAERVNQPGVLAEAVPRNVALSRRAPLGLLQNLCLSQFLSRKGFGQPAGRADAADL